MKLKKLIYVLLAFVLCLSIVNIHHSTAFASYAAYDDGGWMWPVPQNANVFSPYGNRSGGFHYGIDISENRALDVVATRNGTVVSVNNAQTFRGDMRWSGAGCFVTLEHRVNGIAFYSTYAHMASQSSQHLRVGTIVRQGQKLGVTGNTGNAGGTHLHFQVSREKRLTGQYVNGRWVSDIGMFRADDNKSINVNPFNNTHIKSNNRNLYSHQDITRNVNNMPGLRYSLTVTQLKVLFNTNGGLPHAFIADYISNRPMGALPTPTRSGHTFAGWFTSTTSGTQVTQNTVITRDTTLYARWTAIPTPGSLRATANSRSSITVSWNRVANATGYEIQRASSLNGPYTTIMSTTNNTTVSFANNGLSTYTNYFYRVRAFVSVNGARNYGSYTSPVSARTRLF